MIHFTPPPAWHLGPLAFNSHSLAFCLGAIACYICTYVRLPKEYRSHLDDLALWMTLAGIGGARILYMLINWQQFASPLEFFSFQNGGLVSYGGFLGAIAAWTIYIKKKQLPMEVFADALGPAAVLGWGIGRFGCFFNWYGECGTACSMPWGFVVGQDIPRHPVMLYLALGHCAAAAAAAYLSKKMSLNAAGVSLAAFGFVRFVLDYWRDYDPAWLYYGSLAVTGTLMLLGLGLCRWLKYPYGNSSERIEANQPS